MRRSFSGAVRVDGLEAAGVDVSMGGVRVENIDPAPDEGSEVLVEFVLPGGDAIATRAEVQRVEDERYVLRFLRLDPDTLIKLARFANDQAA